MHNLTHTTYSTRTAALPHNDSSAMPQVWLLKSGNALYQAQKEVNVNQAFPKILPWLANRSGIPLDAAEKLWIEALSTASSESRVSESSDCWKAALNQLLERISVEPSPFIAKHSVETLTE